MKRSLLAVIAIVAVGAVVSAGVVYAYEISSANPCAGVNLGPGFNTSASRPSPVTPAQISPSIASPPVPAQPTPAAPAPAAAGPAVDPRSSSPGSSNFVIQVVAAENVWGDLLDQIGGSWTNVTSIITDPNTDPHEYQSNDSDAKAIDAAQYIVLNNVGYDDWASQLISADGASNQLILNIGDSLGVSVTGGIVTGNPHLWYNPTYVHQAIVWMTENLTSIEPSLGSYFMANYDALNTSINQNFSEIQTIKDDFAGTKVAATESIFVYLANATGLDLVSPPAFMEAIAEGNDPPDQSVVQFQCQLESGEVEVLVFNAQTVTPITTNMKTIAADNNVSIVSVTESVIPPYTSNEPTLEQVWFHSQLQYLYIALDAHSLGE